MTEAASSKPDETRSLSRFDWLIFILSVYVVIELYLDLVFAYPHWFPAVYASFDEREAWLPIDQHLLLALVAPRPLLVLSAAGDAWSDPDGEYTSAHLAAPVYELLGAGPVDLPDEGLATRPRDTLLGGVLGTHLREGEHAIGLADWTAMADFADRFLRR